MPLLRKNEERRCLLTEVSILHRDVAPRSIAREAQLGVG
jgi:hypothetical protein